MKQYLALRKSAVLGLQIVLLVCCIVHASMAQQAFIPAAANDTLLKSLLAKVENHYKETVTLLPSENKKDLREIYELRWENIKESFDRKEIYTSPKAQQYLDAITAEIITANPSLQNQNINCFFSRSGVPNAMYVGEGVILFNMGLFDKLANESQAAFVISHELSHMYMKHIEHAIDNYVGTMNSKETQKQLRTILHSEYNKREQLEKLLKGMTFTSRRHSRNHEGEADSMALTFMKGTRFDMAESLTTLALLDSIDIEKFKTDSILAKTFNAPDYPFKKKWIAKEDGLLGGHAVLENDKKIEDSVKTHPDCKTRIRTLTPLVEKLKTGTVKNPVNKYLFDELRKNFRFEVVEFAFADDNYARSLYYALQLLDSFPNNPYLVAHVGKIMNACYTAQKGHTLGKHIDLPAPYYRPNYNLLLQFIQNLYLNDYASIGYHFLKKYQPVMNGYAPFKEAWNTSIQLAKE